MHDLFSDPAWKLSTLLAAAFGGFLTIWIGKFAKWGYGLFFSKNNREIWQQVKKEKEENRNRVYAELIDNPVLIIINTLYVFIILCFVLSIAALVVSIPSIIDALHYSRAVTEKSICPPTNWVSSMICATEPIAPPEYLSDEAIVRYLWIVAPALFCYFMFFFAWFWARLWHLLNLYRLVLKGRSIVSPWF